MIAAGTKVSSRDRAKGRRGESERRRKWTEGEQTGRALEEHGETAWEQNI